jgi:spermidine synthase
MIPWVQLGAATMPGDGGELRLMQRGAEFSIMSGPTELMNSRLSGSEEALATLAVAHLGARPKPRMLIGGLGMGFTLRAALGALGAGAGVVVAELVPEVVAWARGPMAALHGSSLDDPRVEVRVADVAQVIGQGGWDAVLLDVDNGPEGLSRRANDGLYDAAGLARMKSALTAGGVLTVWSSAPDAAFSKRLRQAGFAVEEVKVRARAGRGGARHVIWVARAPGGGKSATPVGKPVPRPS